jgi:DNA-binding transcriptional MerR regulator
MKPLTVRQLARLSGVSVRALHHYDHCGLLRPAHVGSNGYRYYGETEFLRLQQILLHRELGLSLRDIAVVLDAPDATRLETLRRQRTAVADTLARQHTLLATLDRTIAWLEGDTDMNADQLFEGFESPKQMEYEAWLVERGGDATRTEIETSRAHLKRLDRTTIEARMTELEAVERALAAEQRAAVAPDAVSLSPLVERHRQWVTFMWGRECSPAAHGALADLYLAHPDFVARYERRQTGFARFLADAMRANAARVAGG